MQERACKSSPTYPLLHVLSSPAYHPPCIYPLLYLELYTCSCVKFSCLSCCAYSLLYILSRTPFRNAFGRGVKKTRTGRIEEGTSAPT